MLKELRVSVLVSKKPKKRKTKTAQGKAKQCSKLLIFRNKIRKKIAEGKWDEKVDQK